MATAAQINLTPSSRLRTCTTQDAAITLITCSSEIGSVAIQVATAAGRIVTEGATQGGAYSAGILVPVDGAPLTIYPTDCGYGSGQAWQFGVARNAAGAVFTLSASLR